MSWEDHLEEETATHFSILAWKIPRTEELGGLQSMGLQRYFSGNLAKKVGWSKQTASSLICWKSFKKSNLFTNKLLLRPRYSFGFSFSPLRLPGRLSGSLCEAKVTQSCPTLSNSMDCPWNSPGQNTGVGSFSLLQGIFPTQGSNPGLAHCRRNSLPAEPPGSPRILDW